MLHQAVCRRVRERCARCARRQAGTWEQAGNAQARAVLQDDLHELGEKSFGHPARRGAAGLVLVQLELRELLLLELELDLRRVLLEALVFLRTKARHDTRTQTHE